MNRQKDFDEVGTFAREIVAKRAVVVAVVVVILHLAGSFGLPDSISNSTLTDLGYVLDALGALVAVLWARSGVTVADPALNPVTLTGEPLVVDADPDSNVIDYSGESIVADPVVSSVNDTDTLPVVEDDDDVPPLSSATLPDPEVSTTTEATS